MPISHIIMGKLLPYPIRIQIRCNGNIFILNCGGSTIEDFIGGLSLFFKSRSYCIGSWCRSQDLSMNQQPYYNIQPLYFHNSTILQLVFLIKFTSIAYGTSSSIMNITCKSVTCFTDLHTLKVTSLLFILNLFFHIPHQ